MNRLLAFALLAILTWAPLGSASACAVSRLNEDIPVRVASVSGEGVFEVSVSVPLEFAGHSFGAISLFIAGDGNAQEFFAVLRHTEVGDTAEVFFILSEPLFKRAESKVEYPWRNATCSDFKLVPLAGN
jgi:hypothetical protein